ncbi:hypothetical protein CERZMDRAFT_100902 [Cercospora zeae-maydis SCOH1-5]|uniref:Uncharacterized protein n=1 Tax=Cercospora zeae-maydis SCOH1-5 TaxID=717836 RepID=A0A6A6F651_9PEZI|nr:hypothetical protein CERZMDRAFT_100902 [Cercospora zeae-maydis SCOH1-5]
MDNVLFYGERDEATRRQVRSAAAAHSHRIGPRKPKAALKPPSSTATTTTTTTAATATATATSTAAKRRSTQLNKLKLDRSSPPSTAVPHEAKPHHPHRAAASVGASAGALRPQHVLAHTASHVPPAGIAGLTRHPHSSPPPSSPDQPHVTGVLSSLSPTRPTSSPDLSQRLPQYSWTEYPRYALSSCRLQSLDTLADVVSTAREAEPNLPDLRHFEKSADGRPILPPLSAIQHLPSGHRPSSTGAVDQNMRAHGDAPRYNPCIEFLQHARPQANSPLPG